MAYTHADQIKAANEAAGFYFFSPEAMKGFRSKIYPEVYHGSYFVTSEKFVGSRVEFPRVYKVRRVTEDSRVVTVAGPFDTLREAKTNAKGPK